MNKKELIEAVSEKSGLSVKDAAKAFEALRETVTETLMAGDKITLVGFGTLEIRERAAKMGRNPQTGEAIEIKASRVPAFRPGKALKETLNQ